MSAALVIGAGLAGLTAAMDLADMGWRVTLVERRPFAGGRTFSFTSRRGHELDNGQHVFLGCCSAYVALLHRLGQWDKAALQRRLEVRIVDADRGSARLASAPLPAPLHLLPSLLSFPYLSPREKCLVVLALIRLALGHLPEDQSFAAWLSRWGQSANAIERLWNLVIIPTCNAPADRVSARQAGFVFREGLLRRRAAGNMGYARLGLSDIVPRAALSYLEQRGAELRFGDGVECIDKGPTSVRAAVTAAGQRLSADSYVSALPPRELHALVGEPWTRRAAGLPQAPIVGVNLWYDRPVFDGEVLAAIVDGGTFWLFDRTRILGQDESRHHVAVSISAADDLMEVPREDLARLVAAKVERALPAAAAAQLLDAEVTKVRAATFVPASGSQACRLAARTPLTNLYLAGSWTDTGWPDTMESAVRSGHAAAAAVAGDAGEGRSR